MKKLSNLISHLRSLQQLEGSIEVKVAVSYKKMLSSTSTGTYKSLVSSIWSHLFPPNIVKLTRNVKILSYFFLYIYFIYLFIHLYIFFVSSRSILISTYKLLDSSIWSHLFPPNIVQIIRNVKILINVFIYLLYVFVFLLLLLILLLSLLVVSLSSSSSSL